MLRRTFLHLPGIGPTRERRLWRAGVDSWDRFRSRRRVPGVGPDRKPVADRALEALETARTARDWPRLARAIPRGEHWRFFPELAPRAGYLDIETTGVSWYNPVTVVGVLDAATGKVTQLVRERDLDGDAVRDLLARFDLLVTFNGAGFDLPVLETNFPGSVPRVPHLDLRPALGRLGLTGGLKSIERQLGMARPQGVEGLDGAAAVTLWSRYFSASDGNALDRLLAYNREDVVNLAPLARLAVEGLTEAAGFGETPS